MEYFLKIDELNPLYEKVNQQLKAQNALECESVKDEDIIKLDIFNKNEDDNFICFDMNVYNEFNDCIRQ